MFNMCSIHMNRVIKEPYSMKAPKIALDLVAPLLSLGSYESLTFCVSYAVIIEKTKTIPKDRRRSKVPLFNKKTFTKRATSNPILAMKRNFPRGARSLFVVYP